MLPIWHDLCCQVSSLNSFVWRDSGLAVLCFSVGVPSSLFGTLPGSCLAAEFCIFCYLAQCLAHATLHECLLSWVVTLFLYRTVTILVLYILCAYHIHSTSAFTAWHCSQQYDFELSLRKLGNAKPQSLLRLVSDLPDFIDCKLWYRAFVLKS